MLTVENLSCCYDGKPLFAPLSFQLTEGEILIVRGRNGAGKTTLLRCLAGLVLPVKGSVKDVVATQYIGHSPPLSPHLTIKEQVIAFEKIYKKKFDERTRHKDGLLHPDGVRNDDAIQSHKKISDFFCVREKATHFCAQLSAGQKQRLSLSRLLLTNAPLWLLDEPTTALDDEAEAYLWGLLQQHQQRGGSAIIATHQPLDILHARRLELQYFSAIETDILAVWV